MKVPISTKLDTEIVARLDKFTARSGIYKKNGIIEEALKEWLDKKEKE